MNEATNEVSNVVKLSTGEMVDFGKNGTVISSYDVDAGTVTFKVATGEVITFQAENLEYLNTFQREVFLYGLREKVKTTLAPIKLVVSEAEAAAGKLTKAEKIALEFKGFVESKFVTRTTDSGSVVLSPFLKAYAYIVATGQMLPSNEPLPPVALAQITSELNPAWVDVSDSIVISQVKAHWEGLDKKVKSALKRNGFINTIESYIVEGIVSL